MWPSNVTGRRTHLDDGAPAGYEMIPAIGHDQPLKLLPRIAASIAASAEHKSDQRTGCGVANELCGALRCRNGQHVAAVDQRELCAG